MVRVPFERLVSSSAHVVHGHVMTLESRWTVDGATIVTDVTLGVAADWAERIPAGRRITLEVEGGVVGRIGIRTEHQPEFRPGEEVVVFLEPPRDGRHRVAHLEQGKFAVAEGRVHGPGRPPEPLASFRAAVRRALAPARPGER
jgi:hypothetical protein